MRKASNPEELEEREAKRKQRGAPGKQTLDDELLLLAEAAPGKRSLFEVEQARAQRSPPMSPASAVEYARWMLSAERGWAQLPLAARGVPGREEELAAANSEERLEQVMAIVRELGSGQPLPDSVTAPMQDELHHPLSHVRIHTGAGAASAAALLGAQAFTLGHHIYFGEGQFAPDSDEGARLLRHELTHVIQHARGQLGSTGRTALISPSSAIEEEARAAEAPKPLVATRRAPRPMPDWAGQPPEPSTPGLDNGSAAAARAPLSTAPTAVGALAMKRGSSAAGAATDTAASAPSTIVNLTGSFEPPRDVAALIERAGEVGAGVKVRLPGVTQTAVIQVRCVAGRYVTVEDSPQLVPMSHPLFVKAGELRPMLRVRIGEARPNAITGHVTIAALAATDAGAIQKALQTDLSLVGLRGFALPKLALTNSLENGVLGFGTGADVAFILGGWVHGRLSLSASNEKVSFAAAANLKVKGLQDGELTFTRDAKGNVSASASLGLALGEHFTGKVKASYRKGDVAVQGEVSYHSEKLSGHLSVMLTDAEQAEQMLRGEVAPESLPIADSTGDAEASGAPTAKPGKRGLSGQGNLHFAFTDWLAGTAKVVYGPSGHLTVIGKIAPPKQIDLMKTPKSINQQLLPDIAVEVPYGLPYIGNVHLGLSVGLDATAGLGPIYMTDLAIDGTYSTDPKVMNQFSITGTLRAQAEAALRLKLKGYAGVTVLKHHVNAGVEVFGEAGIRGYAEARTTLGYREKALPRAGKQGEYILQGHLEMVAQPVLAFGGSLFVELDSPAFSPAPDKRWTWPVGEMEYPLDSQLGIGADVDYVIGSGKWPEVKLTQPSFDPGKLTHSMMNRALPARTGKAGKQTADGSWSGQQPARPTAGRSVTAKTKHGPKPTLGKGTKPDKPVTGMLAADEKKNVPKTGDVARRWNAGMQDLEKLQRRAQKDPETKEEIDEHLGKIKAKHGFTTLSAKLVDKMWHVTAEMNPASNAKSKKPAEAKRTLTSHRIKAETEGSAHLGAKKVKGEQQIHGHFEPAMEVEGTRWNWQGFPTGKITQHPANKERGFNEFQDLMMLRPVGSYVTRFKHKNGTPGGGGAATKWRTHLEGEVNKELKKEARNDEKKKTEAKEKVYRSVIADYPDLKARFSGKMNQEAFDVIELNRPSQWQAHHIQEHSWGGDKESNMQFLNYYGEHLELTNWWENRADEMKEKLLPSKKAEKDEPEK